jgi:hypothetical protein
MKQYLLSVWHEEIVEMPPEDEMQKIYKDVDDFNQKLQNENAWVFGGGLEAPSTATVVNEKDGDVITTDGPFAEAKEQLGGFWIIQATDLDAALKWASEATVACRGPVEVRPFQDEPES